MNGQGFGAGHVIGGIGVTCLCISTYLFGVLQQSKAKLGAEVERRVRNGIKQGAAEVFAPEMIEDRSAAVGRGLTSGMIDGAIDKATSEETRRFGRDAAEIWVQEADAVAGMGLDMLGAALAPVEPYDDAESARTPDRAQRDGERAASVDSQTNVARRRASLVEDAAEVTGEAMDLGFDVLDALLGAPRKEPSARD